jgi:F-type H+-transporting ATPase subunit alpha
MAELTIQPDEISEALRKHVEGFQPGVTREEVGHVTEIGDGVARVEGLPSTLANELLEFPGGVLGVAMNLDVREIGVVIMGPYTEIEEGDEVKHTGRVQSIPVGDGFLGRVVNALGQPLDGKGDISADEVRPLEVQAASVVQRQQVKEPLQTGIKAIDAMTPIGRGQRELIIGDRQTGKTAVAVDAIINQRANWESGDPKLQVKCIYVAIGQKASTVREVVTALEEAGAMEYTVVVNSPASDFAALKYIAPYAGAALGAHWMYQGQHALIVYDDLSKQAEAYREVSLLLRRPPGREAYPGDVFYLHSRLLERAAKLGVRPAINVGISVSRVGGNAQIKAMKSVAGRLRLDLAQYRALEAFAQFGSDLDKASQAQLARGARMVEVLKQPQYQPVPVEEQVISLWAGANGYLDDVPVEDVRRFEAELLEFLRTRKPEVGKGIVEGGALSDDVEQQLKAAIEDFQQGFQTTEQHTAPPSEEPVEGDEEDTSETVQRRRPPAPHKEG